MLPDRGTSLHPCQTCALLTETILRQVPRYPLRLFPSAQEAVLLSLIEWFH